MGAESKKKINYRSSSKLRNNTNLIGIDRKRKLPVNDCKSEPDISKSLLNSVLPHLNSANRGDLSCANASKLQKTVIMNHINKFKVLQIISTFERRVTALAWHPKYPHINVAASKGGELTLHSMNQSDDYFCPGIGAGGSIVGLKFCEDDPCAVYTASITGNIRKEDFHGKNSDTLLSTLSWENWFSCLDVCYNRNLLLTGDCTGHGYLLATSGHPIWKPKRKFHDAKLLHCEFNSRDPNIFVTASLDHSVKLWDMRLISNNEDPQPLRHFTFEKGVNSAYFSRSNGLSLLATDQHSEMRVYSSPCWDETIVIKHPHRQFQHTTPIEATWHPLEDIIVVGRYPDDNILPEDTRTIDFYDGLNGELLHRMKSPTENLIPLNSFNCTGDTLASAAGSNVVYLKDESVFKGVSCSYQDEDEPEDVQLKVQKPGRPSRAPRVKNNSSKKRAQKSV